jgi:hypothetical protein
MSAPAQAVGMTDAVFFKGVFPFGLDRAMKHFYPVRHPPVPPEAIRGETTPPAESGRTTKDKAAPAGRAQRPSRDKTTPERDSDRDRK